MRISPSRTAALLLLLALCLPASAWAADACHGRDRYAELDVDRNKVFYRECGQGPDVVLLVHGWACDHTIWRLQAAPLAAHARTLLVDLPGHGRSDAPDLEYTQELFAKALEKVMDHAQARRAVLAGHSMGASVIRQYALRHPERVAGLVLADGVILDPPDDAEALAQWQKDFQEFAQKAVEDTRSFVEPMFTRATPDWARREILDRMQSTSRRVAASAMRGMTDRMVWTRSAVEAPTLALYAQSDELGPGFGARLLELFPDLDYRVWDKVGHFYLFERPDRLTRVLLEFTDKALGQAR